MAFSPFFHIGFVSPFASGGAELTYQTETISFRLNVPVGAPMNFCWAITPNELARIAARTRTAKAHVFVVCMVLVGYCPVCVLESPHRRDKVHSRSRIS